MGHKLNNWFRERCIRFLFFTRFIFGNMYNIKMKNHSYLDPLFLSLTEGTKMYSEMIESSSYGVYPKYYYPYPYIFYLDLKCYLLNLTYSNYLKINGIKFFCMKDIINYALVNQNFKILSKKNLSKISKYLFLEKDELNPLLNRDLKEYSEMFIKMYEQLEQKLIPHSNIKVFELY